MWYYLKKYVIPVKLIRGKTVARRSLQDFASPCRPATCARFLHKPSISTMQTRGAVIPGTENVRFAVLKCPLYVYRFSIACVFV
jgi:hypothetical protein